MLTVYSESGNKFLLGNVVPDFQSNSGLKLLYATNIPVVFSSLAGVSVSV